MTVAVAVGWCSIPPTYQSAVSLPPAAERALRGMLPSLAREIVETIGAEVEPYARPVEGRFGRNLRGGVEVALERFLDRVARRGEADPHESRTYVDLGRLEFAEGRTIDVLLAAYRIGARVAWQRLTEAGMAAGLEPETMYRVGYEVLAYIDELSAESAEGFAQAQAESVGELESARRATLELAFSPDPEERRRAPAEAARAGVRMPSRLAIACAQREDLGLLRRKLGSEAICAEFGSEAVALLPDPDGPGRRRALERALKGVDAGVGPAVAAEAAADSLGLARRARAGRTATGGASWADALPLTTLLPGDDPAFRLLARRALAPLEEMSASRRTRLTSTLRAWLDHQGRIERTAVELGVHPQTVRYRMRRLTELYGASLDDPETRLALSLALRLEAAEGGPG